MGARKFASDDMASIIDKAGKRQICLVSKKQKNGKKDKIKERTSVGEYKESDKQLRCQRNRKKGQKKKRKKEGQRRDIKK